MRRAYDEYTTDMRAVRMALAVLPGDCISEGGVVLDPGAGTGNWGKGVAQRWPTARIIGIEIQDYPRPPNYGIFFGGRDFLDRPVNGLLDKAELVVGNPPFNLMEPFINEGLKYVKEGGLLGYFARYSILEGLGRWLRMWEKGPRPKEVHMFVSRPDSTGEGGDRTAYAFFVFQKGLVVKRPELDWIPYFSDTYCRRVGIPLDN